jgi:proliferating cell nuclear antigen
VTKEGLRFSCSGDIGVATTTLRQSHSADKPDRDVVIDMREPCTMTFAIKWAAGAGAAAGLHPLAAAAS